jgi:Tol biopolymer transport system component
MKTSFRLLFNLVVLYIIAFSSTAQASNQTNLSWPIESSSPDRATITRVSVASDGTQANEISINSSISADGRYIAFDSLASNLVSGDTNNAYDVFVHDMLTGQTERVSVSSRGKQANGFLTIWPSISADGRYVAFDSDATNLVDGDTNINVDTFLHDRLSGVTELVSVALDGGPANGHSRFPAISANGRFVAFDSLADNLVSGDTNQQPDVFVRDLQRGTTELVSRASDGMLGNGQSESAALSADGRYVAFVSFASNLVSSNTSSVYNIFVHDRLTGETEIISQALGGAPANNSSEEPVISADGRYVAFDSSAGNLVSNDTNHTADVFVCDRMTGQIELISLSSQGTQANDASFFSSLSLDGRFVAFESLASNLVGDDTNGMTDVFVHDRLTKGTWRVSVAKDGLQGEWGASVPSISGDGRYVGFNSGSTNLVYSDTNNQTDIFVYKRERLVLFNIYLPLIHKKYTP